MRNMLTFIATLSVLFIGHINAPIDIGIAAAITNIIKSTPDAIAKDIGKSVVFMVNGDIVNDGNLLMKSEIQFNAGARTALTERYFTDGNKAQLKAHIDKDHEDGYSTIDILSVTNEITRIAWNNYGAIRTIYEYQTRKTANSLISNWPVRADTFSTIPDAVYASYMEGTEALVLVLTDMTADQLAKHLGQSVGFRDAGTRKLGQDQSLQLLKTSFLESANRAVSKLTSPERLLGQSRVIQVGYDVVHKKFMDTLLEKAWTDYALAAATTAYDDVPAVTKDSGYRFDVIVPPDRH